MNMEIYWEDGSYFCAGIDDLQYGILIERECGTDCIIYG